MGHTCREVVGVPYDVSSQIPAILGKAWEKHKEQVDEYAHRPSTFMVPLEAAAFKYRRHTEHRNALGGLAMA